MREARELQLVTSALGHCSTPQLSNWHCCAGALCAINNQLGNEFSDKGFIVRKVWGNWDAAQISADLSSLIPQVIGGKVLALVKSYDHLGWKRPLEDHHLTQEFLYYVIYTYRYVSVERIAMVSLSEQFYKLATHSDSPLLGTKAVGSCWAFWSGEVFQQSWKRCLLLSDQCFLSLAGGSQQRWPQMGWLRWNLETASSRLKSLVCCVPWD